MIGPFPRNPTTTRGMLGYAGTVIVALINVGGPLTQPTFYFAKYIESSSEFSYHIPIRTQPKVEP
jgi:hypothetical protein